MISSFLRLQIERFTNREICILETKCLIHLYCRNIFVLHVDLAKFGPEWQALLLTRLGLAQTL